MNHRELLKKYMTIVGYVEGVTFVPLFRDEYECGKVTLSDEEWEELKQIERETN